MQFWYLDLSKKNLKTSPNFAVIWELFSCHALCQLLHQL